MINEHNIQVAYSHGQTTVYKLHCSYFNYAGCYRSEVRLVGGQAKNEGRVELRYKGKFGTVCQTGFNMKAAHVVCRQLGYPKAVSVRRYASKYYGKATGPVHLNGITCRGDERSLYHCGHKKIGFSVCPHKLDVGVVCFSGGAKTICDKKRKDNGRSELWIAYMYYHPTILLFIQFVL